MKIKIVQRPSGYDSNTVVFLSEDNKKLGSGYQSKETGVIYTLHCPKCKTENYMVTSNISCYNCDFNPNKKLKESN